MRWGERRHVVVEKGERGECHVMAERGKIERKFTGEVEEKGR